MVVHILPRRVPTTGGGFDLRFSLHFLQKGRILYKVPDIGGDDVLTSGPREDLAVETVGWVVLHDEVAVVRDCQGLACLWDGDGWRVTSERCKRLGGRLAVDHIVPVLLPDLVASNSENTGGHERALLAPRVFRIESEEDDAV